MILVALYFTGSSIPVRSVGGKTDSKSTSSSCFNLLDFFLYFAA